MNSRFGKYIPVAFFITLLFIVGNFFITLRNVQTLRAQEKKAEMVSKTKEAVGNTLATLLDAESAERAYLITQDDVYLNQYEASKKNAQFNIAYLKELTKEEDKESEIVYRLGVVANERLKKLQEGISILNEIGYESATEFVRGSSGRALMEKFQKTINELSQVEQEQEIEREEELDQIYSTLYAEIFLGTLLTLVFVVLSYYLFRRELEQRTQLEKIKDEFINMTSHELKTPITSLKVYIEVVQRKIVEENLSEASRYLSKIDEQTNKLTNLIIDLLDMSRIQTGKMRIEKEALNLDALIDDTAEAVQGTTRKHKIISEGALGKMVYADRYRIYQVLVNLLTNAIKYSPKGGQIIIKTKVKDNRAIISVKDFGIGIDPIYKEKIFERLYQVTEHKGFPGGLGIGLFISNEIVKMHGGQMWVKSIKGKGSTFYFDLPFQD